MPLLDLLAKQIEAYEEEHHNLPDATPAEVLQHLMQEHDLEQTDLAEELGGQSVVSAILSSLRSSRLVYPDDAFSSMTGSTGDRPRCAFCMPAGPDETMEVFCKTPVRYSAEPVTVAGTFAVLAHDPGGLFYRMADAAGRI